MCTLILWWMTADLLSPTAVSAHSYQQEAIHAGFVEQTEDAWQLWCDNTFPPRVKLHALKISHSLSSWTRRKLESKRERERRCKRGAVCGGRAYERENSNCVEKKRSLSKNTRSFPYNSSVASQSGTILHWLPTPAGRTEVLLRKEISSLLRQRHLNYFVVSRSPLGKAEVESSAGTCNEKVSCSVRMKFSSSNW